MKFLGETATRIINEVKGVIRRVVALSALEATLSGPVEGDQKSSSFAHSLFAC